MQRMKSHFQIIHRDLLLCIPGIYFILLVIIGTYFSVNICVAAISGVFLRVRHEHQVHHTLCSSYINNNIVQKHDTYTNFYKYFLKYL
jgi:hypothetical protein